MIPTPTSSQTHENLFKKLTVCEIKWFRKAMVLFWLIEPIYNISKNLIKWRSIYIHWWKRYIHHWKTSWLRNCLSKGLICIQCIALPGKANRSLQRTLTLCTKYIQYNIQYWSLYVPGQMTNQWLTVCTSTACACNYEN